jgi:hypothetical protein
MANNRYREEILNSKGSLRVAPMTLQGKCLGKQSGRQGFQPPIYINSECFFRGGE